LCEMEGIRRRKCNDGTARCPVIFLRIECVGQLGAAINRKQVVRVKNRDTEQQVAAENEPPGRHLSSCWFGSLILCRRRFPLMSFNEQFGDQAGYSAKHQTDIAPEQYANDSPQKSKAPRPIHRTCDESDKTD
jgi:hypothetical protein